jgi:hypothetical protein
MKLSMLPTFTFLFLVLLFLPVSVHSADIRYERPFSTDPGIVIEGPIRPGDFGKFETILREGRGLISRVWVFSPGGDFEEAMKIGRLARKLELTTEPPSAGRKPSCRGGDYEPGLKDSNNCICASAGFFIYIGGIERIAGHLIIHRPRYASNQFGTLSPAEAEKHHNALQAVAASYMREMELPTRIIEEVLAVPSNEGKVLDHETVSTYLSVVSPARQEWLQNRCGGFRPGGATLEVENCISSTRRDMRLKAFEDHFKVSSAKLSSSHAGIWTDFLKYLGHTQEELRKKWGVIGKGQRVEVVGGPGSPRIQVTYQEKSQLRKVSSLTLQQEVPNEQHEGAIVEVLRSKFGSPTIHSKEMGENARLTYSWELPGGYLGLVLEQTDKFGIKTFSLNVQNRISKVASADPQGIPKEVARDLIFWRNSWELVRWRRSDFIRLGARARSLISDSLEVKEAVDRPEVVSIFSETDLSKVRKVQNDGSAEAPVKVLLLRQESAYFQLVLGTLRGEWGNPQRKPDRDLLSQVYYWEDKKRGFSAELSILESTMLPKTVRLELKALK